MSIKKLMETHKKKTKILGDIQRSLLGRESFGVGRSSQVIHPSEICKPDACPREIYYRLSGWKIPLDSHPFGLEVIFAQGHAYHEKWQSWVWDIGKLRGSFGCLACGASFEDTSPTECSVCQSPRHALVYLEVPVSIPDLRIGGKSDGDIDLDPSDGNPNPGDPLLEIKSVGTGTVRFEAPALIARNTKTVLIDGVEKSWTDWDALWRDIRHPFPTHLRQGAIYGAAMDRPEMVFIYEFKPTGAVKEFVVKHDFEMAEPAFEVARAVLTALEKGRRPKCPSDGCKGCTAYEELRNARGAEEEIAEDREAHDPGTRPAAPGESRDAEGEPSGGGVPRASGGRRFQHMERRGSGSPDGRFREVGRVRSDRAGVSRGDRGAGRENSSQAARPADASGERDRHSGQGRRRVVRRRD